MANFNNYQQAPFWEFMRSFEPNGAGVDHPAEDPAFFGRLGPAFFGHPHGTPPPPSPPGSFPWGGAGIWGPRGYGPGHCGRGGRRGRHGRRDGSGDRSPHGSSCRSPSSKPDRPEGEASEGPEHGPGGRRHGRGGHGHRGGWGHHGHHGRRGPPPAPFGGFGEMGGRGLGNLSGLLEALNSHPIGQHPWAQAFRNYAQQAGFDGDAQRSGETAVPDADDENTFVPPIDIFSTETSYVLHIALPGAKKEDVGINWDADKGVLSLAGVVYRQGDEDFLKTLSKSERKVGVFERTVQLPPGAEEKEEEVDGDAITAKLEDGVLVVTVPKVEKEWTEVKRVDIE